MSMKNKTPDRKRDITLGYFALLYAFVLFFLLLDNLFWYIRSYQAWWGFFYMFTNQSNMIMMMWLFLFGITMFTVKDSRIKRFATHPTVVAGITLYISIVFLVVALVLTPFYRAMYADHLTGVLMFTHLISAVVMFAFFFFVRTGAVQTFKRALVMALLLLVYPLSFLLLNLAIGLPTGDFAYDFVDPSSYSHVALYIVTLLAFTIAFWILGVAILLVQRALKKNLDDN